MKPHKHRDVIVAWADGAQIEYRPDGQQHWTLCGNVFKPSWAEEYEYRVKPEPPTYPVTLLSGAQLMDVVRATQGDFREGYIAIANAALRHAIDAGQIVTKDEHESALIQLGERLRGIAIAPDAKRDMAIAKAVCMECKRLTSILLSDDANRAIGYIDLAAIISTIK